MTNKTTRRLFSYAAIAAASLFGVRLLWVSPTRARAEQGLARIEESRAESQRLADAAATAPAHRNDSLRADAQAAVIRSAARASGSESGVFETLEGLAARAGVHLEQVRPQRVERAEPGSTDGDAQRANRDVAFRTTVTVHGTYEGVTQFIAALARHDWYASVRSGMIVRRERRDVDQIIATLEVDHFGPELAPTVSIGGEE
ncbi:MAG: hypothetical protein WAZ94_13580 [Phycisphaerales bacterium]